MHGAAPGRRPGSLNTSVLNPVLITQRSKGAADTAENQPSEWAETLVPTRRDLQNNTTEGGSGLCPSVALSLTSSHILFFTSPHSLMFVMFPAGIRQYFSPHTTIEGIVLNLEFR